MHDEDDVVGLGHAPARQGLMGSENAGVGDVAVGHESVEGLELLGLLEAFRPGARRMLENPVRQFNQASSTVLVTQAGAAEVFLPKRSRLRYGDHVWCFLVPSHSQTGRLQSVYRKVA